MKKCKLSILLLVLVVPLLSQNRVLILDGDGDYISLPNAIIDGSNFSIEAWYRVEGVGGGTEGQNLIFSQRSQNIGCYNSAIILLAKVRESFPYAYFSVRTDQSCSQALMTDPADLNEWHHIVATLSYGIQKIFIDGNLVAATLNSQEGSYATNLTTIEIGRHFQDNITYGYFNGAIDELRVWDYGLSEDEIKSRMFNPLTGNEVGLLAYWNFEGGSAVDVSQHGHDGQLIGDATTIEEALPSGELYQWGDLNHDGQISVSDVIVLINHILGLD
ncbi:MAG: LamG domain-containing protein [Candidatus Marinimicrobia bacterium]|nr:LamG domain-containing protein [Candidatus Neomarinimicrobiota bacterium]